MGACSEIPAVEMSADEDDFVGKLGSADFSDHVMGHDRRQSLAGQLKKYADIGFFLEKGAELLGAEGADGGGRDAGTVLVVAEKTGMRVIVQAERQGSDKDGGGAVSGRLRGAADPVFGRCAVGGETLHDGSNHRPVEKDDFPLKPGAQGRKFIE